MDATFFATAAEFRAWLEEHHDTATELSVGFYKTGSGRPSITWPESVDQALCFGWIDGIRKGLGTDSYSIRFTPRRPRSIWSKRNIARVEELSRGGLMRPAGVAAYEARSTDRSGVYSFEQERPAELDPDLERELRADPRAWSFFTARPPSYRRAATHWVMSAKKEETRRRRLALLIEHSARGETVPPLTPPSSRRR